MEAKLFVRLSRSQFLPESPDELPDFPQPTLQRAIGTEQHQSRYVKAGASFANSQSRRYMASDLRGLNPNMIFVWRAYHQTIVKLNNTPNWTSAIPLSDAVAASAVFVRR